MSLKNKKNGACHMEKEIFVTRPYLPPKNEYDKYLEKIWQTHYLTNNGPLHSEFMDSLKSYLNIDNVTLTTNGHLALETAIKGLGISGEVITTPFTFVSTTHALTMHNITPVFCDINPSDLTMDADKIEALITEKTTAIMPVHVYGHICDVEKIQQIASTHGLKVIYDAAHAFGVNYKGASVASYGDVSMFSFHATKLFHTIEGGALIYKNSEYTQPFNAYKNFGFHGEAQVTSVGGNAKMNEFQAAMGLTNLLHVEELIAERKEITLRYRENLGHLGGIRFFEPENNPHVRHNYAYMPILIDAGSFGMRRDGVYEELKNHGIYSRRYFCPIVSDFKCYSGTYHSEDTPIARAAGKDILCLPIYNGLEIRDVDRICSILCGMQKGSL